MDGLWAVEIEQYLYTDGRSTDRSMGEMSMGEMMIAVLYDQKMVLNST